MRVAVIKSNGHIDHKIERLLSLNKINGDFITKFTINSLKKYEVIVFSYKNKIPNLPKILESIILEQSIFVVYINNTAAIGEFYNILDDLYFTMINEQNLEIEFLSVINNSLKYLKKINDYKDENKKLKNQLDTTKLVNNAKYILMSKGFNEAESHQFIQKIAMDQRLSKKMAANLIIENKIDI